MAHKIVLALATAALLATPVMAGAQRIEQRTVGVTHTDLDLATEDGRAELERRIDNAARSACAMDETDLGTRVLTREKRACYRDARAQLDQRFARVIADGRNAG
ncbi:MAG: UrcA family protein [Alteraurantiacibacter sp.]